MKKLTYGKKVVGLFFIVLSVITILIVQKNYSKESIDSINKIIHNNEYKIKSRFVLNESYYSIIKEAEKRRLIAEQNERWDKLKAEKEAELEKQRLAKLEEKKKKKEKVNVSRGKDSSNEWYWYEVTFYTAGYESTQKKKGDKDYGITASGNFVKEGQTAACPKSIEFGTKLYIEGIGYRVCEDRGGAITHGHLDIYVDSVQEARKLGRKKLKVKIIE